MTRRLITVVTCVVALWGCQSKDAAPPGPNDEGPQRSPATRPAPTRMAMAGGTAPGRAAAETSEPQPVATPGVNYGAERSRLVNQKDEILSTLENGIVVIAKRVSSPVVSVRAYVYTGGVYEG